MPEQAAPRSALIVAAHDFADAKLRRLRAPAHDAEALADVLRDPAVGEFDVDVSLNEPEYVIRRRLTRFFRDRGRDDLLLLHFSCHGLKDEDGRLYFAAADTSVDDLEGSAVAAEFVNALMARSLSRRIVLLLDCCYSGAFSSGTISRAGDSVDLGQRFDGRGRVVLTASDAMEYAFEGDRLSGEGSPSLFTSAVVSGLASGEADLDQDGLVSFDELYKHVYDTVRERTPSQTPKKWTFDVEGDLVVARSPRGKIVTPAELPEELVRATEYPIPHVREGAVRTLAALLHGSDERLALSARLALERLVDDDSRLVAAAAAAALGQSVPPAAAAPAASSPAASPPPAPVLERPPAPDSAQPAEASSPSPTGVTVTAPLGLATAAAALLVLGFLSLLDEASTARALFLELLAVAFAAVAAAVGRARGLLSAGLTTGILLGFGIQTTAAGLGWLGGPPAETGLVDDVESAWVRLVILPAGLALLVAALRTARSESAHEADAPPERIVRWLAFAGAAACLAALVQPMRTAEGDRHEILREGAIDPPWVAFEPVAACIAIVVAAAAVRGLRRRPELRAGMLLSLGAQTGLYFVSYVLAVEFHEAGSYGRGGVLGVIGACAVASAGLLDLHRSHVPRDRAAPIPRGG